MSKLFSFNQKYLGIDLGTANIIIVLKGKRIILRQPSTIAINNLDGSVVATGNLAKDMIGRVPEQIKAIRPLQEGTIVDFKACSMMLSEFFKNINEKYNISKPVIIATIPNKITQIEENAVSMALMNNGAKEVYLVDEILAAAIGSNIDLNKANGNMIVNIGGGTTQNGIISLGGIVTSNCIKIAGDNFDNDIINYIRKNHQIAIGKQTAEELKINIGCATSNLTELSMDIKGRDLKTRLPKQVSITSTNIQDAIKCDLEKIISSIKTTLEKTPPELIDDIIENGIILTGGGANLRNIDLYISEKTNFKVYISDNPLDTIAKGINKILNNFDNLKGVLFNSKRN